MLQPMQNARSPTPGRRWLRSRSTGRWKTRDGAVLNVDGQTLPFGSDQPLVLPVEPGTHTVRVTRPGYQVFEKNITVAVNSQQEFPIALRATPATLIVRWPAADRAGAELRIDGAGPTAGKWRKCRDGGAAP